MIGKDPSNLPLISEEFEASKTLRELSVARDSFLAQKAKMQWLQKGDSNSAYFHGLLKKRRNGNRVIMIEDRTSKLCDTPEQLTGPLTGKEVRDTLFSIPDIKTPGPDGYMMEWSFVEQLLNAFMFPTEFKAMVLQCITTASFSLSLNGDMFGYFQDDVLLFSKGDTQSMMLLLKSFTTFYKAFGLKVSAAKSNAYFQGVPEHIKQDILRVSGFVEGLLPFKYLGMPIQTTRLKKIDCECLVEKICCRIHNYGVKKFSYAGRLVLVKVVLSSLHSYWASMFIIPKGVISRIEATCMNFLWDNSADYRRVPLVAWDKLCSLKQEGGLGLKDQEAMNKAMIGRLVHWIIEEKDSIWVQWVKKNYLKGKDWLEYKPTPKSTWVWRRICKVKEEMLPGYTTSTWTAQSTYSPAACYKWLKGRKPTVTWYKWLWNEHVIPKHQFIGWLYAHGAFRTKDKLIKYGLDVDDRCLLCEQDTECIDHLLCECVYSRRVIQAISQKMQISFPVTNMIV
ncbi:uncharacterized protein LOC141588437 [Silene latifolia]|uniref:uncharacterized protein LOC141588437 n=1 Tax=Silene latifolia TaxID=37657 RepID=UPI003D783A0B